MLTKIIIRNFKRFNDVEIELGSPVVLIGPNNSGKTAALQALALWDIGVKRWIEKRETGVSVPKKRRGVTINRRDLTSLPVPDAKHLWRNLHVREVKRKDGKQISQNVRIQNVRIEIILEGITGGTPWRFGIELDFANAESFYCRPLRLSDDESQGRMPVPDTLKLTPDGQGLKVAFLPPMSGLAANETRLDPGAINVRIGEGRTAEVLRNLCYGFTSNENDGVFSKLQDHIRTLFGVELEKPEYIPERGELSMTYRELDGIRLDLSASGRGLQQTLLLLAYLYANPGAVILLDEPDAHLEILRQRQIYNLVTEVAGVQGGQIIAASHSEVVLNEAAGKHTVIAFVGKPHRIDDRGSQLLKSLTELGYDQYYQGEQKGWVLYLEGPTDLAVLKAFAERLDHPAANHLARPFVHYVGNNVPKLARAHFHGLREAVPGLQGIAIFDRLDTGLDPSPPLEEQMWQKREIENYLSLPEALLTFAGAQGAEETPGPLFAKPESERRQSLMDACVKDLVPPVALRNPDDAWWHDEKASVFLGRLFNAYFAKLGLPNLMRKADYHRLALLLPRERIDKEVQEKLDAVTRVAESAVQLSE